MLGSFAFFRSPAYRAFFEHGKLPIFRFSLLVHFRSPLSTSSLPTSVRRETHKHVRRTLQGASLTDTRCATLTNILHLYLLLQWTLLADSSINAMATRVCRSKCPWLSFLFHG